MQAPMGKGCHNLDTIVKIPRCHAPHFSEPSRVARCSMTRAMLLMRINRVGRTTRGSVRVLHPSALRGYALIGGWLRFAADTSVIVVWGFAVCSEPIEEGHYDPRVELSTGATA